MPIRAEVETSFAKEAFQLYLQLPKPRRLKDLVGIQSKNKAGRPGRPLSMYTLTAWSATHHWAERAQVYDDQVLAMEAADVLEWRKKEARRREMRRLQAADLQMEMALDYLAAPQDPTRSTPRALAKADDRRIELASRLLKQAGDTERLDLGQATSRHESLGAGDDSRMPGSIVVLDGSALDDARKLLDRAKAQQPQIGGSVIDVTPSKSEIEHA